jgi:Holliday junction resolvase RusA-like endonuclease
MFLLPKLEIPEGKLQIDFEFGFSNSNADYDNAIKPFQDILQKKYGFNDSKIHKATIIKTAVKKGEEFISFEIKSLEV